MILCVVSENMDHQKNAGRILQQIAATLDTTIEQQEVAGLLNGYTGSALFYAAYYNLTGKKKYLKKVHHILQKSIQYLSEEVLLPSHCNGISGIVWCIQYLIKMGFAADDELEDIFTEVDDFLGHSMLQDLENNHYDFLHQGLGIALYFLERDATIAEKYLTGVVAQLERAAVTNTQGVCWTDHFSVTNLEPPQENCFNLGLAHGIPAMISILGMIAEKGVAVSRATFLADNAVNWLLSVKNQPDETISSIYPVLVNTAGEAVTGKQSRLGWCYGDLGIAITLLQTGIRLNNEMYRKEAEAIFAHTLQHRTLKNGSVHDACLCHGSAGISHIYRRAYLTTGNPLLLEGAEHWLQQTLRMNTWKDGPAGYKFNANGTYENSYNLLEGITGVGLALTAALDPHTAPGWDRCLLLS